MRTAADIAVALVSPPLAVSVPLLAGFSRRWVLRSVVLGIVIGFGLQFLFTRILVTDLP